MNHFLRTVTFFCFNFVALLQSSSAVVEIKLKPFIDNVPADVLDFAGFFFQPYVPAPTVDANCKQICPCAADPNVFDTCDCGTETACGGEFPLDLSSDNKIDFFWDASSDDSKYISIKGTGRTRVEFQATVDCEGGPNDQEISGNDIQYEIDDEGLDSARKFVYNPDQSFIIFGKCDGCTSCEIYTRLQFDPNQDGVLDINLKSLKFSATYDPSLVVPGELDYEWSTKGYCWMRDSQRRRQLLNLDKEVVVNDNDSRLLEDGVNTYELLDLPGTTSSGAFHGLTLSFMTLLVAVSFMLIV